MATTSRASLSHILSPNAPAVTASQASLASVLPGPSFATASNGTTFRVGDKVRIDRGPNECQALSVDHGGWRTDMAPYCYKLGIVHRITVAGDIRVRFGMEGNSVRFTYNPDALKIIFFPGDLVETIGAFREMERLQNLSPDYTKLTTDISSRKSHVIEATHNYSCITISFDGTPYRLNPNCLRLKKSNTTKLHEMIGKKLLFSKSAALATINSLIAPSMPCIACESNIWKDKYEEVLELYACNICFDDTKRVIFPCGHGSCKNCSESLSLCHMCRKTIREKIELF